MRIFLVILCAFFGSLYAQEDEQFIVLQKGEIYQGDYFATGRVIEISGTVNGDVFAFGSQILIDGHVTGSVIATGGTIEVSGTVDGSTRLIAGQVEISGTVGRNVTAAGGNIQIISKASVGKNAVLAAGIIDISGDILGDLTISGSNVRILGKIGRNVRAFVGELRVGSRAQIIGNLDYSSHQRARIDQGAKIDGQIRYKRSFFTEIFGGEWKRGAVFGSELIGFVMNFIFSFVIGALLLKFSFHKLQYAIEILRTRFWKSILMGMVFIIVLPIAALILFITIFGIPLGIALIAFSLIVLYAAKVVPIFWLSNILLTKIRFKPYSLLGFTLMLILFLVLIRIPYFGAFLSLAFTLIGLGTMILGQIPSDRSFKNQHGPDSGEKG